MCTAMEYENLGDATRVICDSMITTCVAAQLSVSRSVFLYHMFGPSDAILRVVLSHARRKTQPVGST